MIEPRYRRAVDALRVAAAMADLAASPYSRGVLDAASFVSGLAYSDEFAPVYDRYTEFLVTSIMRQKINHT